MIKCEFYRKRNDDVILVKTFSTEDKLLLQKETGLLMTDTIDVGDRYFDEKSSEFKYKPKFYTYLETDEDIPVEDKEV